MILQGSRTQQGYPTSQVYPFPSINQQQSQIMTPNFIKPFQSQIIQQPIIQSPNLILQPPSIPVRVQQSSRGLNKIFEDATYTSPQQQPEQFNYYNDDIKIVRNSSQILINWLFYFMILIFILIIIVISGKSIKLNVQGSILFQHQVLEKPKPEFSILENVQQNLKKSLIIDMYTINYNRNEPQQCIQNYQETSIGEWSGLKEGCICQDGSTQSLQQCLFRKDCNHIKKQNPIALYKWVQNKFCLRKADLYYQFNWVGSAECPNNQRKCSPGLCVSDDLPCPVSGFIQTNQNNAKLKLTQNFGFTRENSQPFVDLVLTPGQNQSPCYVSNLQPRFQSKKFYPLAKKPEKGCVKKMNEYTFTLDKQLLQDVYQQNHITAYIQRLKYWERFSSPDTDYLSLQAIKRIQLGQNPLCGQFIKINFKGLEQQGQNLSSFTRGCSIILIVFALLAFITGISLFIIKIHNAKQTKILFIFALILSVLMIVTAISFYRSIHQENGLESERDSLEKFYKLHCFVDQPIISSIQKIKQFIDEVFEATELQIKIGLIITLIFLIASALMVWIQRKYQGDILQDPWE